MDIRPNFIRNIAKSVGYATASAFGDMIPTVKNTMENNKNYIANAYSMSKERLNPTDIKQTLAYKSGQELVKNAIADLKSGQIYNKQRQKEAQKQSLKDMGLDFDFDSFNFDLDGNASSSESETNESGNVTNTQNIVITNDSQMAHTVDSSIGKLSRISTSAMRLNHMNSSIISKQMSTMIEFQTDQTAKFYTEVSGKMAEMTQNISQMTGFMGVMAEVTVGGTQQVNRNKSALRNLLGLEGLDVEGIVGLYKNKFMGNTSGYGDMFNLMVKPIIDEFVANPLGMAMKTGIKAVLPKAFKSALGEFDTMFKNIPIMMQGKLKSWEGSDSKYKKWASQIFGLDLKEDRRLNNFSNYEKGKVAFDGITRRTIVNVIPSLLSKILSAVSDDPTHKEELVYDHQRGVFTTKKRIRQSLKDNIRSFSTDNFEVKRYKEEIIHENKDKFDTEEKLAEFIGKVDKAFDKIAKNSVIINSNVKFSDISNDEDVANAILNNFESKSSSGKAKYQRDFLEASKGYTDVYDRIRENESFQNAYDISDENPFFKKETNKEMAQRVKQMEKLTNNIFGNGDLDVENTMSKKNPFYWLTEGIRKMNSSVADYMFDNIEGNPITDDNDSSSTSTSSATSNENNSNKKKRKGFKFFSSGFRKPSPSGELRPKIEAPPEEEPIIALNSNIADLNQNVEKNNKILKGENEEKTSSSTRKGGNLDICCDEMSFLPRINDNILHIIALLEAKFSGDGLPLDKIGKFKDKIHSFKDKTLGFFDRFFTKGKGRGTTGNGMVSRVAGRVKGFIDQVFGKSENRESMLAKLLGGISDSIRGANGKRSIVETFLGKEGLVTKFVGTLFTTVNDTIRTHGPKVAGFIGTTISNFMQFGKSAFETMLGVGKKGFGKIRDMRDRRKEEGKGGIVSLLLGVLGGVGQGVGGVLGGLGKGIGFAKDKISSLLGKKKEDGEGTSSNRKKLSVRDMFDKVFNEKNNLMHVFVDGGNLDRIREVVKVKMWTGHEGSAEEQFAEFEARKNKLSSVRQASERKKRDRKNPNYDPNAQNGQGGSVGGLLGTAAQVIDTASDLSQLFGDREGREGRGNIDPNSREGRRQQQRQQRRGRLGRLFGRGGNTNTDPNTRVGRSQGQSRGLLGRAREGFSSIQDKIFQRRQTSALTRGATNAGARTGVKGALATGAKAVGRGLKFVPGLGLVATAGMGVLDAVNGAKNAGEIFETHNATLGQKISAGAGGVLSGLSFGLLDRDKMAQGIYGLGSGIGNIGKGIMNGLGGFGSFLGSLNPFDNPLTMFGGLGGLGMLAGRKFLSRGRARGSFAEGGVVDYTGKADVHGSKDKPEMVLNSDQTTGLYQFIRQLSEERKRDAKKLKEEKLKGEKSRDPMVRTATWMEKLGKFMTVGAGGMFFGGILGAVTGKVSGVFGKVAEWFKGIFKPKEAEASGGSSSGPADYSGSTNAQKAWNFFKSKGFTDEATAGILGNLQQESGINPTQKQLGGGPGRGLMQWEEGGRWDQLVSWANKNGKDPWAMETQLDYMWLEMTEKETTGINKLKNLYGGMDALKNTKDYKFATKAFEDSFERAGKPNYEKRYGYASNFLNEYKGTSGSGGDPSSSAGTSGSARDKIVQGGQTYVGKLRYAFGGTNIEGGSGDCSAFTRHIYKKFGNTTIGRTTGDQVLQGKEVPEGSEQPGDLVFFKGTYNSSHPYGVSHVGIVIGGGKMVHLSSSGCNVDSYKSGYWGDHYLMVRSYLGGGSSSAGSSSASPSTETAGSTASNWFKNIWDYTKDIWGEASNNNKSTATSGSDKSFSGGPSSTYTRNTFEALQGYAGTAMGNGTAYVANGVPLADMMLGDSRWTINNSTIQNAMNSITKMNSLNNSVSSNPYMNLANGMSGVALPNAYMGTTTNIGGSSAVNTALTQMAQNAEDISNIQSLLRQMNENGREGNETLQKMLNVLMEIRENAGNGGVYPFPLPNGGYSGGASGASGQPSSTELEKILGGA